jgi:hypothetical protein
MTRDEVAKLLRRQQEAGLKSRLLFLMPSTTKKTSAHSDCDPLNISNKQWANTPFGAGEILGTHGDSLMVAVERNLVELWLSIPGVEDVQLVIPRSSGTARPAKQRRPGRAV